ncbi:unnamed protein product [Didymodactylos carnosus]|uniref:Uncharacterized protein n=1 Tax=Didymodactylos carnosus TaxID=1234261 RepID=A0A814Z650_9BILA|nr:unnamed protein product [Didymodactylos carnosus]CAF1267494.1 unnamed protein product [Didymodactylos carnosus]CAF4000417.1 unnamed protein product [Didymodactylos carnosus]CAF4073355.1 unnamed protein product [Didymodactylos carnosus]
MNSLPDLYKKKNKFYRYYKKNASVQTIQRYKNAQKQFDQACLKAKKDHIDRINHVSCASKYWWYLLKHSVRKGNSCSKPVLKNFNQQLVYDHREKANILNDHFVSICTMPANQYNIDIQLDTLPSASTKLHVFNVTGSDIEKILSKLDVNKAAAPGVTNRLLRESVTIISEDIAHICRMSLHESIFPESFKTGYVNALFKGGDHTSPDSYRPIH